VLLEPDAELDDEELDFAELPAEESDDELPDSDEEESVVFAPDLFRSPPRLSARLSVR
jgi:hypothetical protein